MSALVWLFVRANWKPIAIVMGFLALLAWHKLQVRNAWYDGRAALVAEQTVEAKRRNDNANAANDAAAKCARDPACLLQSDGHRRD
jgi:hypothetical protein